MTFVQRYTAPLLARIPDVSDIPTKRLVIIGIVISIVLHLLIFLAVPGISWVVGLFPSKKLDFAKEPMKPREIELQVVPEAPVHLLTLEPDPQRMFMDSRGLTIAKDPSDRALFESDQSMRAANELAPSLDGIPLPGQEGKERAFNAFENTRSLLGPTPEPFSQENPLVQPPLAAVNPPAPPPAAPPAPQVAQQKPPAAAETLKPPAPAEKTEKKPTPDAKEQTKPTELRAVEKPKQDEIALMKRESIPEAITEILKTVSTPSPVAHAAVLRPLDNEPVKPVTPVPQPRQADTQVAKLTTPVPRPVPAPRSGYQPEQEKNHIESTISNRGKSGVDANASPMAKYRKQVNDAIGSRWYYYIRNKMDLMAFGSVRVSFVIDAQGHISHTRVEANSANESLAEVSRRAIEEAEIGPPPPESSTATNQEPLDWTLTFTYYPF